MRNCFVAFLPPSKSAHGKISSKNRPRPLQWSFVHNRKHVERAWAFIRAGALTALSISDQDLPDLQALMTKYHDRAMDFADATLGHLAHHESLSTVFTIDHDDFATDRIGGRKRFR